jgi:hypothetical protein
MTPELTIDARQRLVASAMSGKKNPRFEPQLNTEKKAPPHRRTITNFISNLQ